MRIAGDSPTPQLQLLPDETGQLRVAIGCVGDATRRLVVQAVREGLVISIIGDSLNDPVPLDGRLDPAVLKRVFQVRGGQPLHQVQGELALAGGGIRLELDNSKTRFVNLPI